jgi:hypothetical protein
MITIVTNPFTSPDPYTMARQAFCRYTLDNLAFPKNVRVVTISSQFLPRSAITTLQDKRDIPFIRDLVRHSKHVQSYPESDVNDDWFGVLNNDTIVTERFFEYLTSDSPHDVLIVRVWDIPHIPGGPDVEAEKREPQRRYMYESIDGIFFKQKSYDLWRKTFPDFLFSEEWDRGMSEWVRRYRKQIKVKVLDNAECLHVVHGRPWRDDPNDKCKGYNLKLLEEFRNAKI